MSEYVKAVTSYIEKQQDFAQEILNCLRETVHSTGLEITEEMKWSFPNFMYKKKILCSMAGFKQHCSFGFWNASLMEEEKGLLETGKQKTAMGNLGKIKSVDELPEAGILRALIFKSASLIDEGKTPLKKPSVAEKKELVVPEILTVELEKNPEINHYFNSLSYSHRKEYIEYIAEAKREETRVKRVEKTMTLLKDKKHLNHKYEQRG